MKDKDFEQMMKALKDGKFVTTQKELAELIGCAQSVVSDMRNKNRFPVDWVEKVANKIDLASIDNYDPAKHKPKPPKTRDYKFFNQDHTCSELYGSESGYYAHQFPDALALNKAFLKKKQLDEDNIFLFKDEKGTNTPDIMAQDILVVSRVKEFCGASYYLFLEYCAVHVRYMEKTLEGEFVISEKGTGFKKNVDNNYIQKHMVGMVVLKLTENIRSHK